MIFQTTHLGQPLTLILLRANWDAGVVRIKHTLETEIEEGLSVRENRRPVYEAQRLTLKATLSPGGADAAALNAALGALKDGLVGIPIYPDILPPARWAERIYDAEFTVAFGNTAADGFQILHKSALQDFSPSAFPYWAPLLVGRFDKRPELAAATRKLADVQFTLLENSPWNYRIFPAADPALTAPDWPADRLKANWNSAPIDLTDDILEYKTLGKGRLVAVDNQEGAIRRGQELTTTLPSRDTIRALLNFQLGHKGRVLAFNMPVEFRPAADTPETPHATRYRFATDDLELTYLNGNIAETKFRVQQVPWELNPVTGEQPAQPARRFLYRFTFDVPGGPVVWRYTDYERDLPRIEDGKPVTYLNAQIAHDKIAQGCNLDDNAAKITSWFWANHPLTKYLDESADKPFTIEILECDPQHPDEAELRYIGDVDDANPEGRQITAATTVLGSMLETKIPGFYAQSLCNHDFCDEECAMREEDFICAGAITAINGLQLTIAITSNPNARALAAEWFANGWLTAGLAEKYQAREVLHSNGDPAKQTLTIDRLLNGIAVGDTVQFSPSCPGTCEACKAFGNFLNFGGHPCIPPNSPSLPTRQTSAAGGKK